MGEIVNMSLSIVSFLTLVVLAWNARLLLRSIQSATYNQIVDQNLNLNAMVLRESDVVKLALLDMEAETEGDVSTKILARTFIDHFENVFLQHGIANLPDSVWPQWRSYMIRQINSVQVIQEEWLGMKKHMHKGFVKMIDEGYDLKGKA